MRFSIVFLFIQGVFAQFAFTAEIHEAAKAGNQAKIVQLVKSGVSPDLRDKYGNTPFLISVIHGKDLFHFLTNIKSTNPLTLFQKTGKFADRLAKNKKGHRGGITL